VIPTRNDPPWLRGTRTPARPQVSVYLPLPLQQRIVALRQRSVDINVSAVCQAALEQAVAEAEDLHPVG